MTEAVQRRLHNNGLVQRFYGEGLPLKAPTDEGESEAAARVLRKNSESGESPLALMIMGII